MNTTSAASPAKISRPSSPSARAGLRAIHLRPHARAARKTSHRFGRLGLPPHERQLLRRADRRHAQGRPRRHPPRRLPDAAHLLQHLSSRSRRRHHGHRLPQPRRLQRLQDLRGPRHDPRPPDPGAARADGEGRCRTSREARARRARSSSTRSSRLTSTTSSRTRAGSNRRRSCSTPATAPRARSRRSSFGARRQRHPAFLRARRPLPEPSSGSDRSRESQGPGRGRSAREGRLRHRLRRRLRSHRPGRRERPDHLRRRAHGSILARES